MILILKIAITTLSVINDEGEITETNTVNIYSFFIFHRSPFVYTPFGECHCLEAQSPCSVRQVVRKKNRQRSDSVLRQDPSTNGTLKTKSENTQTPPKCSIRQQLRTDFKRPVGVTTVTQQVWLTDLVRQLLVHIFFQIVSALQMVPGHFFFGRRLRTKCERQNGLHTI